MTWWPREKAERTLKAEQDQEVLLGTRRGKIPFSTNSHLEKSKLKTMGQTKKQNKTKKLISGREHS